MHELSITESVVSLALEKAREAGAKKITGLSLVIGELTGVMEDSVRLYFDFIAKDTIAEGASIAFRSVPAAARCRDCDAAFRPEDCAWTCPQCGSISAEIIGGRELFLESIDIDGEDTGSTEHTGS